MNSEFWEREYWGGRDGRYGLGGDWQPRWWMPEGFRPDMAHPTYSPCRVERWVWRELRKLEAGVRRRASTDDDWIRELQSDIWRSDTDPNESGEWLQAGPPQWGWDIPRSGREILPKHVPA